MCIIRIIVGQGGDKLTLNLIGTPNVKNTNATSPSSPLLQVFPSLSPPPSAGLAADAETPSLLLNGSSETPSKPPATESVTVTHFSEKRGTMEKISVPSLNIFNAEFKNKGNDGSLAAKSSTNPFLNMSPTTQTVSLNVTSTNPFHVTTSPTTTAQATGNGLPDATEAALDAIILLATTNPFHTSAATDKNDHRHNDKAEEADKEVTRNNAINNINNNNNEDDRNSSSKKVSETYTKARQAVNDHFVSLSLLSFCSPNT